MLSFNSWIDGFSAFCCFIFAISLGLGIIYHANKLKTRLLLYMGISIFLAGFFWLMPSTDFLTILITRKNLQNPNNWMGIVNFLWAPLVTFISMYIGAELMVPKIKRYINAIFLILCIIFEVIIFLFPMEVFQFSYPSISGDSLIYIGFNAQFPLILLLYFIFSLSGIIFCGFGYLIKGFQSTGVVKKKFSLLSIGYFLFLGFPLIRTILWYVGLAFSVTYVRIGMVSSFLFFYSGLKEEPEEKIRKKDEIKIQESLFRLTKKPSHITEEEVTFYREKRICLVCKNKVSRINFICPKCSALYCLKCSEELINLENMCWVCDEPIDESKPIKPSKEELKEEYKKLIPKTSPPS
ncbi:MAG: hypothetical protein ACFFAN_18245 [Promethearchaeota archaeon]